MADRESCAIPYRRYRAKAAIRRRRNRRGLLGPFGFKNSDMLAAYGIGAITVFSFGDKYLVLVAIAPACCAAGKRFLILFAR
jgi:hypothetical protein